MHDQTRLAAIGPATEVPARKLLKFLPLEAIRPIFQAEWLWVRANAIRSEPQRQGKRPYELALNSFSSPANPKNESTRSSDGYETFKTQGFGGFRTCLLRSGNTLSKKPISKLNAKPYLPSTFYHSSRKNATVPSNMLS